MKFGTVAVEQLLRALPRAHLSRAVGMLCDLELPPVVSRALVGLYVNAYRVNLAEAATPPKSQPFHSFDDFFTRRLRPGVRTCSGAPDEVVSPADGQLEAVGTVEQDGLITVKGQPYSAADLLCSQVESKRYAGGQFAVIYLSPRDYHRVHSPVSGRLLEVRSEPGEHFPVNSLGQRFIPGLLALNRRVAMVLDTGPTDDPASARLTLVMVAAMFVGRITVAGIAGQDAPIGTHLLEPPLPLEQADELGIFHLGSTVVLFAEPGRATAWDRPLGPIRLGESLSWGQADGSTHG